jgi:butyryl-CoA:acetate CoA-transferase
MMDVQKEYQSKLVSADEAVKCVKSGDWVDYSLAFGIPIDLDEALAKRLPELEDLKIRSGITSTPRKVLEADTTGEHLTYMDWHWTSYIRNMIKKGSKNIYFEPLLYRNLPMHYRKNLHVNVAMIMTTPMNDKGYFNFSITNSATRAILDCADVIIVETNTSLPWVYGVKEECVHISEVNFVVEGSSPAIPTLPAAGEPSEIDKAVASYVVPEIVDGSTLQLGIGGMPNAIGAAIADSDLKDLGIHTEMLVDAYYKMFQAGKITNSKKNIDKGRGVFGFAQGSSELYEWARENPGLVSAPIDYCNDPYNMAKNDNMMSINNCIEIDLFGQICAEASGTRQLSGTGGQLDFLTGAHMSKGGKAFICMSSSFTDKKTGETKSRIVPRMREGSITTDPRNQAMYIVTEYGIVNLAGRSTWEIAENLISIAHPDTREGLIAEAEKMNIWRRSNK